MDNETCQVISDACSNGSSPAVTVPIVDDSNDVREERTTKKGRRKGSKGRNDENWRYCVKNCLHSGKSLNELIQCHLCQSWIHPECVGEDGKDIVGIWTCTSCRQLPVLVSRLLEKTSALESLIEKLTVSNQQLVALVVEQQQDLRKLSEKISNPITDTIDLNPKVETLLVGNSLLRDVHFDGPDNRSQIRVVKKSGATFKEIEQMIDEAAKTHTINEIVIVGGTTETMGDATADDVRNEVSRLLRTAKSAAPSVKLSSVIPTKRRTTDIQRRNTLNDQLRATCEENNATFVDNDNNFTFRNGAVDNAAFANDGLHLSDSGVDRLMSNLGLPPRSSVRNKPQQQNRRPAAPRTPSRDTPNNNNNNNNNNAGTSDHEWCVIERRNRHRHSIGKCANCSETNHVTANCKHHQKVQCRQCGERGHKEKHHTRN